VAGKPVAYKLMTSTGPTMLATPKSLLQARGGFALKNIWVTPHTDSERWPAGDYTIQSKGGEGLPLWTKQVHLTSLPAELLLAVARLYAGQRVIEAWHLLFGSSPGRLTDGMCWADGAGC
jgi:hypothetical protein